MKRRTEIKRVILGLCISLLLSLLVASTAGAYTVTTWPLRAGQTMDVGTVAVWNDAANLYVQYNLTYPGATFGTLHMWAGTDIASVPANKQGILEPGQFSKALGGAAYDAAGLTTHTFTIPFGNLNIVDVSKVCNQLLYIVAHAEVTMDSNHDGTMEKETAFGGNEPGGGPRWWFYGTYAISCDFGTPQICSYETAFAKGGYVWTTDAKSNPEKLPSLNLTKNRWGWAINLKTAGTTTYKIWAGAGLNKTANAEMVGTLEVTWSGAAAIVAYQMSNGYSLEEVHIYAGDKKPTTTAPGQYGYPTAGYDVQSVPRYESELIPLMDTDNDGVWLIAHGVVSSTVCR